MSYYNMQDNVISAPAVGIDAREILKWVYMWMSFGLLVTAGMAFLTVNTTALSNLLLTPGVMFVAIIAELLLVMGLAAALPRLNPGVAAIMFVVYSALNGFTLASIFFVYELGSISMAFVSASALFGAMTLIGFTTKTNLEGMGAYLRMGLIGLVIAMVVNVFIGSSAFDMVISAIGVLVFTGLTAYDTQKIKRMAASPALQSDGSMAMKLSLMGALTLYLDFINLFLFLLRIMGGRRN